MSEEQEDVRINKIKFRRAKDNKYFGHFDTKQEAFDYLKELARRYKFSPLRVNTVNKLCREAQEKGIYIYPTQVGKWFREVFDVDVKYTGKAPEDRVVTSIYLDADLHSHLGRLQKHSKYLRNYVINTILRTACGLPVKPLLVYLDKIPIVFVEWKEKWINIAMQEIDNEQKRYIESILYDLNENGIDYAKQKLEISGNYTIGGSKKKTAR